MEIRFHAFSTDALKMEEIKWLTRKQAWKSFHVGQRLESWI